MRLHSITPIGMGLCLSLLMGGEARSATFTIADPQVDFEVIDGGFENPFDGVGDQVFPTFNTIVLGTSGEAAEFAEFDLGEFPVAFEEMITNAIFQVQITNLQVGGLGVPFGDNPSELGVFGYVGNGIAEAGDFDAGVFVDSVDISSAAVGDILTFDTTEFVQELVGNGDSFVGLGVRALGFGGLAIEESSSFPRMTITTAPELEPAPEPASTLGLLAFGAGAFGVKRRLKRQQQG